MIRRFHIEDLVVQDASGVVFRAHDSETGRMVAIRRFFPFGADGGGLHADEQTAYRIALGRLTGIHHPALRSVVAGGCDPVDGMPFIATEWVDGEALDVVMDGNPLPIEAATLLISQALEVSELLSLVLAEEAVWVETTLDTIVVSHAESGRGFTFWISPLKWLGNGENRGLESIITLAEEVMGWQGCIVSEQAGRGLGAWIKWLRTAAPTTSLHEAREMLAASVGAEPPPPAKTLAARATRPLQPVAKPSSKGPVLATLCGIVVVGTAVAWLLTRKHHPAPEPSATAAVAPVSSQAAKTSPPPAKSPPAAAPPMEEPASARPARSEPPAHVPDEVERANRRALELSAQTAQAEQKTAADLKTQQAEVDANGGVFSASHRELLLGQLDKEVVVEGILDRMEYSNTRKTLYLVFTGESGWDLARGAIVLSEAPPQLHEPALNGLVGRRIRIRGKADVQKYRTESRPLVFIKTRESVQELP